MGAGTHPPHTPAPAEPPASLSRHRLHTSTGGPGAPRALGGQEPADRGPRALGLVGLDHVPAVVQYLDSAARDPAAELLRVSDRDKRVLAPPDDERRHRHAVQPAAQ